MEIRLENGTYHIGKNHPVFIIAEAGVNHNGDIRLAKQLIDSAKKAGADAVKFQTFKAENIILKNAPKAEYHIRTTGPDKTQTWYELLKTQEMSRQMHLELMAYCKKRGILFLSTPYDKESADLLDELGIPLFKVASTDANNLPFLEYLAKKKKPIILSTGMCYLDEVKASVDLIKKTANNDIILLHCTANYPSALEETNLRVLPLLRQALGVEVGYSDHTLGYTNAIASTAMGSVVFEKHFTVDKNLPGPDHQASLDFNELKETIRLIRETEIVLGKSIKEPAKSEMDNRKKLRKFLVSAMDIKKGAVVQKKHLDCKRTGGGLEPKYYYEFLGRKAKRNIKKDELIVAEMFGK
ncbi:MAG: N-acetylneuraminate synthase [Candidatus Omnitrophica bacterium]|nr:N-acetylneuraminate synthase [Candidatus Omnitrophota bacterium]